jgi:transcriptional regulator GlxA family with amidase domain
MRHDRNRARNPEHLLVLQIRQTGRCKANHCEGNVRLGEHNKFYRALARENLSVQVPLGQVAEKCGLSVRHLARAFRQSTGVPPHRWLLDCRVKRAKELLPNSTLSLSDVALACGFGDQSPSHVHGDGSPESRRMASSAVGDIGRAARTTGRL